MAINVVFFTQETEKGIQVIDDLGRRYDVFKTQDEALAKIEELNKFVASN